MRRLGACQQEGIIVEFVEVVEDKGKTGVQINDKAQLVYWDDKQKNWVESATSKPAVV